MRRGILFSATMVALLLVIFFVGLHLLLVDFREGARELAKRKGEMMAREVALNLENYINDKIDTVELLSSTLFPFYLEGKISSQDLYKGIKLQMKHGGGVTNVQFFNLQGVVVKGYPPEKTLLGFRLNQDLRNKDFYGLFTRCLEKRRRQIRLIDTLFLDPMSMELKHKPLLVVMYPVMVGQGSRVEGVLMASLDVSKLVAMSVNGSVMDGWHMLVLDAGQRPIWGRQGQGSNLAPLAKGMGMIKVEVPFRVVDRKWEVVAGISSSDVESGVISLSRKMKALTLAFLFVLGLSLFSVYLEVKKSYRALALSEDRFRTLVEGMKEVFYIRGGGGEISYVSPGVENKLGSPGKTCSGLSLPFLPWKWRGS